MNGVRLRRLFARAACALVLLSLMPMPLRAEEKADPGLRLTLKMLHGGGARFTKPLPGWKWRPKHPQLVRIGQRRPPGADKKAKPNSVLLVRDVHDKTERVLLDFTALDELVPGKGKRMRGIGRAGPPRFKWAESGTALCAVVKGDLVWVDLAEGTRSRLTHTQTPMADLRVAPDGSRVSFARDNELWVADTDGDRRPRQLTGGGCDTLLNATLDWVYPEEFGFDTAAWWSPDAQHIAFLQLDEAEVPTYRLPAMMPLRSEGRTMRYPKAGDPNPVARVAVAPAKGGDPVWLDVGKPEYVVRVAWTPDSKRVLVVTLDRNQQHLEVRSCDPANGASVVLFEERDDAWIDAPPAPKFVDGHQFRWRSNRDGYLAWYLIETDPRHTAVARTRRVTPPDFEAYRLYHVEPEHGAAIFGGTSFGGVRDGVFHGVGPNPTTPMFDTSNWGSTSAQVDDTGTYAVVSSSSDTKPVEMSLWHVKERKRLESFGSARTKKLDQVKLAKPEYGHIELPDCPHGRINYRLWKPAAFDPNREYPLIVHTYGGPGSRMVRNRWGRAALSATFFTQRGFLVLHADGRGSGAQGAKFIRTVYKRLGILEIEDQARAAREMAKRPYVDGDRIGIWGWSYGGTMACNALTMKSDVFKVGVGVAPVTDWRLYDTIYTERYMGVPKDNPKGYEETASAKRAKSMNGHLLLMHGLGDDNVHAQNTYHLVEALLRAGKSTFDVMTYPYRGHGIGGAGLDVHRRLLEYFERHLPKDNPKGYEETASAKRAKSMNGHLLLMHGLGDDNVHAQNTYHLVEALLRAGKSTFDVMTYPYRGHGIGGAGLDVHRRLLEYFERHL